MADYLLHLTTLACIYATAAVALQLLVSQTGLLSVAQAVFFGLGAYSGALLATRFGASLWVEILVAMIAALVVSLFVSVPSLRLRGDYFAISTFALQMIAVGIFLNWISVTNGPLGVAGIKMATVAGVAVRPPYGTLTLAAAVAGLTILIARKIRKSPFGLVLRAIRGDELFAQSLAKDTLRFKVTIVCTSAALAAVAGVLYAHFLGFIEPSSFTLMDSVLLLSMVVIGGETVYGTAVGAAFLVFLPEGLRLLGLPSAVAANIRQIVYGLLLVLVVTFRPRSVSDRKVAEVGKH